MKFLKNEGFEWSPLGCTVHKKVKKSKIIPVMTIMVICCTCQWIPIKHIPVQKRVQIIKVHVNRAYQHTKQIWRRRYTSGYRRGIYKCASRRCWLQLRRSLIPQCRQHLYKGKGWVELCLSQSWRIKTKKKKTGG